VRKRKLAIIGGIAAIPLGILGFLGWGYTQLILDEVQLPSRDIGYRLRVAYGFDGRYFVQRDMVVVLPRSEHDRLVGVALAVEPDGTEWLIAQTEVGWFAIKLRLADEVEGSGIPVIGFGSQADCEAYLRKAGVQVIPRLRSVRAFVRAEPTSR
jgi:hypothetical protein